MSDSSSASVCSHCGSALPAGVPESQCPRCLMAQIVEPTRPDEAASVLPPLAPEQLAPHFPQLEILECLGRGGMGVVYKARQKSLSRLVALKLLAPERADDPQFAARFEKEAHALAALNHPHIVSVHDFGQAGGFFYLLMEFVDGVNLRQLLQTKRLTPREALSIVPPVCDALQCAHDYGIVHRDIKPENLLIDKAGVVKIADFGVAKMLGDDSRTGLAQSQPAGTPHYAAPEQANGAADHRADIYSLGVVLYEMLTGERPTEKLEAPSRRVQVDLRIDEIVLKALEKTPKLRFATAAEFRTQVDKVMSHEGQQESPPVASRGLWPGIGIMLAGLALLLATQPLNELVDDRGLTQTARRHLEMRRQATQAMSEGKTSAAAKLKELAVAKQSKDPSKIARLTQEHASLQRQVALAELRMNQAASMKEADERSRVAVFHLIAGALSTTGGVIFLLSLWGKGPRPSMEAKMADSRPQVASFASRDSDRPASRLLLPTRIKLLITVAITVPQILMILIRLANDLPVTLGWFPVWVLLAGYALIWLLPWIVGMAAGRDSTRWYHVLALAGVWWFASMPVIFWTADIPKIQNTQWLALMLLVVAAPVFVGLAARALRRWQSLPNGARWLRAWSWVGLCLAVPAVGFAAFFIHAAATESGGWHPSPNEKWAVPLIMLAALSLPSFAAGLWNAAGGGKKGFIGVAMAAFSAITVVVLSISGGMAARPWLLHHRSQQQAFKVHFTPEGVTGRVVHVRVFTPDPFLSQEMRIVLEGPDGDTDSQLIPRDYKRQPQPNYFVFPRPSPATQPWTDFGSAKETLVAFVLPTEELAAEAYRRIGSGHLNLDSPKPQGVIHFNLDPRKPETMTCTLFEVTDAAGKRFTGSLRFSAELIREGHPRWVELRSLPMMDSLNTLELSWMVRTSPPAAMTLKHRWKDGGSESKGVMSVGDQPPGNTKLYEQRISVLLYKVSDTRVGLRLIHGTQPNTKEFDGNFATLAEEMRTAPLTGWCKTERDWDIELCRVAGDWVTVRIADPSAVLEEAKAK